jgi:hypothetical protein
MSPESTEAGSVNLDTKNSLRGRAIFLVLIAVLVFVLYSAAVAVNTVDKCGNEDSPKHWSFFPPEWVCEGPDLPGQGG